MSECTATVFLVRHADIAVVGGDPDLSPAGVIRAEALRQLLADAEISQIFTTSLRRSRQTAAPLATQLAIVPDEIDETDKIVASLRGLLPGTAALVVGHSNTLPGLIAGLGGPEIPDIGLAEFNNLYVQTGACLSRLRYGA
jgi:phosphohistidine phosphatase SixA